MSDMQLTEKSKKMRLAELSNEVKDFHPLLHNLLPKLPRVERADYTHGPNEKGADFVLTRMDETFTEPERIGIIAKIGDISVNLNQHGIPDQIELCHSKRFSINGKHEISLDEIWIATTGKVSHQAEDKIHNDYASSKIKFVDNEQLIRWIDKHFPEFWMDISIKLGGVLGKLRNTINAQESYCNLLPETARNLYINQTLRQFDTDPEQTTKIITERVFDINEVIKDNKIIFVEAEAGYGKSRLLRETALHFSNPATFVKNKVLPILTSFTFIFETYRGNIIDWITKHFLEGKAIDPKEKVTFLLLIDSIDEKDCESEEAKTVLNDLFQNASLANEVKIVLTSRPLEFLNEIIIANNTISKWDLMPLTMKQMIQFFERLCKEFSISGRIIEDIKKSDVYKQLPKSPISTILLAKLIGDNAAHDLPSNLPELYQKYCELMLGRWDMQKGLQSQKEYDAAYSIIMNLAEFFMENNLELVAESEALRFFEEYLNERNLDLDARKLFQKVCTRSGLLMVDAFHRVRFRHKTFCEYFYAAFKYKDRAYKDIIKPERVFHPFWRNSCYFYLGLAKDCKPILEEMMAIAPRHQGERFMRIICFADYFLASYHTPYGTIAKGFEEIIKDSSKLYCFVRDGKDDETFFRKLPELLVLFIFQTIIQKSYGYSFFQKSLHTAGLDLATDGSLSSEEKLYCLYFLSIISIELELPHPFDKLIEDYKTELPLTLSLAIQYETSQMKQPPLALKKYQKALRRKMHLGDKKLKMHIKEITETPLDQRDKKKALPKPNKLD